MIYRKLKRTWSGGYLNYIPRFRKVFPELSKLDSEELCDRFQELNMDFYYEEQKKVSLWVRLTLPFALALMILMLIIIPVVFMFTGQWGYSLNEKNFILNWFRSLHLL